MLEFGRPGKLCHTFTIFRRELGQSTSAINSYQDNRVIELCINLVGKALTHLLQILAARQTLSNFFPKRVEIRVSEILERSHAELTMKLYLKAELGASRRDVFSHLVETACNYLVMQSGQSLITFK